MKKIKLSLTIILATIILATSSWSLAYNGTDVDTHYEITMPTSLTNGKGTVTSSKEGTFKYQFVETTAEKYSTLNKLADQLELVKAYIDGEYANWGDAEANVNYKAIVTKYESTYNEKVADLYTTYGAFDTNAVSTIRSLWIHELPNFEEANWTTATNKEVSLDLSTFSGEKYYVAWIQLGDTYDAEVYIVNGTKTNSPSDNNNTGDDNKTDDSNNTGDDNKTDDNNNTGDNNKTDDSNNTGDDNKTDDGNNTGDDNKTDDDNNTGDDNKLSNDKNKSSGDKSNTSPKKDTSSGDETLKPVDKLPHTGIVTNIIFYGLVVSAIVSAVISFKRFKNIK